MRRRRHHLNRIWCHERTIVRKGGPSILYKRIGRNTGRGVLMLSGYPVQGTKSPDQSFGEYVFSLIPKGAAHADSHRFRHHD